MATLAEIRQQYPQYEDLPDDQLADALYRKSYSDIPREEFNRRVGFVPQTTLERINGVLGNIAQGPTMGFADEIGAAIGAPVRVLTGQAPNLREGFQMAREEAMGPTDRFAEENPNIATGLQVGGALLAAPAGGIVGAGRTAAGAAVRGSLAGAGGGALYGYGSAEGGVGERSQNAAVGAVVGAAGGAVAGLAGQQLTRAWQGFRAARAGARPTAAETEAMDLFRRNLRTLGYTDDDIAARINQASQGNSERALFEAFDEAHQPDLARTIKSGAQLSPGASSQARGFAETRRSGQQDRITDSFRLALGNEDFSTVRSNLQERFQSQAAPIFNAIRENPVPVTPQLRETIRALAAEPVTLTRANNQARGVVTPMALATDSGVAPSTVTLGALHDLAQDVSDEASAAFRAGRGGLGSRLRAQDRALRDYLKEASPEFRQASDMWRGAKQDEAALDAGRAVFTTDPEDLADMAGDFSQSEREHFVAGVARAFREKVRGAGESHDATRRLASNNLRDRLRAALGQDADRIIATLDQEALLAANENALNPMVGSQTSPINQGAQAFVPPMRRGVAAAMETDLTLSGARRAAAEQMRTPDPRIAEDYVGLLLTPQGRPLPRQYQQGLLPTPQPLTSTPSGVYGLTGGLLAERARR